VEQSVIGDGIDSDADVSMSAFQLQDILIFIVTYISQNVVNCNKLS